MEIYWTNERPLMYYEGYIFYKRLKPVQQNVCIAVDAVVVSVSVPNIIGLLLLWDRD